MKKVFQIIILFSISLFTSCNDDDDSPVVADRASDNGEHHEHKNVKVVLMFDNVVGDKDLQLSTDGNEPYQYKNAKGQDFNISLMGYYISEVSLEGENVSFEDSIFASKDTSVGFYHVMEGKHGSNLVNLSKVVPGKYSKLKFKLGVDSTYVQNGASSGVLAIGEPWFWNWNVGFIAFAIEGSTPEVPDSLGNKMIFHIGGWKTPNNIKTITLNLDAPIIVTDSTISMAHIQVDALRAFSGDTDVDFKSINNVHRPSQGEHIAHNLEHAFMVHHVDNNHKMGEVHHH